ncbi:MAG: arginine--tRNA ligase [Ardenticatenaceae bacterium]|nr:arginine--tRNA ligase [Ardenticatenaceae bacterium]MCB9005094.1 arginine--tRNA ligase [Ardenticatenaceae bacterium]
MPIHHELAIAIENAVRAAQESGDLPDFDLPEVRIERPRDPEHGDYASPIAMQLARLARMAPLKIAQAIVPHLPALGELDEVYVAPPGFINIRLSTAWLQNQVAAILATADYGSFDLGKGKKAQVECVSANPTGPITLGRTRGGVMGDTLARALRAVGYDVTMEYYYNDAGRQVTMLGESVKIRYRQLLGQDVELDDDHYQGAYITDLAQDLLDAHGGTLLSQPTEFFSEFARDRISQQQKQSLRRVNIEFDVYFREQSLYENGRVWEALETLQQKGYVYEKDDAQWFRTTEFGDDKDRVLVKTTGEPTYRMPDIAYHWDKAQRGFQLVVDLFGPDHHATAPQVLMGVQALGYDTDFVHTVLHQIVSLIRDGEQVKMSTRRGNYVTLDELVDEVGADPIRYFMISRSGNSPVDFDMNLAVEHSDKNPVYYIQNAHVRCAGIFRKWQEAGFSEDAAKNADLSLLTHEKELAFLRKALELSAVLETMATTFEPHHIAFYAYDLAAAFHPTYEVCRVLSDDVLEPLRLARLQFYGAAKNLFARVLDLMGMSAPEVM